MNEQIQALIVPIAFMVIVYLFIIRPQKKREKEIAEMRNNLKVGDKIVTIGGITGKLIAVKEDLVIIESSSSKTKFEATKWAVGAVVDDKDTV